MPDTATIAEMESLASRIQVIKFPGYSAEEKLEIINKYLLPNILQDHRIAQSSIILPEESAKYLISITKEDGVRHLKKALDRIIKQILYYATSDGMQVRLPYTISIGSIEALKKPEIIKDI